MADDEVYPLESMEPAYGRAYYLSTQNHLVRKEAAQ